MLPPKFFIAAQNFPLFFVSLLFFSPKAFFSNFAFLSFFLFIFIWLPLLKLLKVKNPFFIAHPTLFFFSLSNPFSFSPCGALSHHHRALSLTSRLPLFTSLALAAATAIALAVAVAAIDLLSLTSTTTHCH